MATDNKYLHSDITNLILQAFYTVSNKLPFGLTTDVYKRALAAECEFLELKSESDKEINILYRQKIIGSLIIDLVINDSVIVKVISDENINEHHSIDAKNQLRLTEYEVCLILNFTLESQHKRLVFTNDIKNKN